MSWFRREEKPLSSVAHKHVRTEGLWHKCEGCRNIIWKKDLDENQQVCPKCDRHFRLDARSRLRLLFDDGAYQERDAELVSTDPLQFVDHKPYRERLAQAQESTGLKDALISAHGRLEGRPVIVCAMEYGFIGGSMGAVVGEKITRAVEAACATRQPLVIISASGGARMMEGAVSLMQMSKIAAALARLDDAGVPFISVLTDPTTGGVTASFAMLGDLNIAEPGALIGFAGPRVIEQTIRQKLPANFQRSEFLLEHGMLDAIVPRKEMRAYLHRAFTFMQPQPVTAVAGVAAPAASSAARL
ncbi:MAG TPA: acetyl-CoA carboxylase, carboxyltransferase subunit beta [Terriglobales bacterium]|jgi:acetyl-CoA carboxylase carboxyl transferase subunit beta